MAEIDPQFVRLQRIAIERYAASTNVPDDVMAMERIEAFAVARLIMSMRSSTASQVTDETWKKIMCQATGYAPYVVAEWVRAARMIVTNSSRTY